MRRRNQKYSKALVKADARDNGESESAKQSAKKKGKRGRPLRGGKAANVFKKALHDHRLGPYRAEKHDEQITSTNELGNLPADRTRRLLLELRRANTQAGEYRYDEIPYTDYVLKELMRGQAKSATLTPFALDSNGKPILDENGVPRTGVVPQLDGRFYQSLAPATANFRQARVGFQEWDENGNQVAPVGPMSYEIVVDPAGPVTAVIADTATGASTTHPMYDEPDGPESILVSEKRLEKLGRLDPGRISEVAYPQWRAFSEATGLVPYHPRYYLALGLGRQYPGGHTVIWGANQTKVNQGERFTFAWQNEIIGYDVTTGKVYRLCHTYNSGQSGPTKIQVSPSGRFILFT